MKQFSPEEIERVLGKLKRRIEDVKALDPNAVPHGDQRIKNVEQSIRSSILEIYGPNSPEFREHEWHRIWNGAQFVNMSEGYRQKCFAEGISQTITMLEGLVRGLEEKRAEHGEDPTSAIRNAFRGLNLHPRIASVSSELFQNGYYRNAVLDAAVDLENGVGLQPTILERQRTGIAVVVKWQIDVLAQHPAELSRDFRPGLPVLRQQAEENFIRHDLVLEKCLPDVLLRHSFQREPGVLRPDFEPFRGQRPNSRPPLSAAVPQVPS